MRSGSRIAIVGAGIAGLVCAKVLTEDGFAVEVFDRAPDIGGVWSETRRYPGLRAQSTKYTYHFSDHPMPADYPRVLDGARMQEYLSSYVRAFGLTDRLRLRTEVVAADPVEGGWLLEIRDADGVHRASCDHLIIANGVFSDPEIPDFAGATAFARAGGQLGHSTQFLDVEAVRDRAVVVVGYGAAAADIATEISKVAADTTLVARRLLWKMPRKVGTGLDAERILLTRTGAAHFGHPEPGRFERLLHGPARSFRESNLDLIEALVAQRSGAAELGLVPDRRFEQAHDAAFGLATEGFAEQVTQGRLVVRGRTEVRALGGGPAGPFAELSDGQRIRADIVVCATGFQQRVPFLTPYVQRQLTDDDGNFRLYRQILPLDVPHLTFAGYNTSLLSAVTAEIGAHWTAALLTGNLALPPVETMSERIDTRLRWLDQHTGGRHAHGTVTPDALREIDQLLADIGVRLPFAARAAQWLRPVRPGDYRAVTRRKRGPGTHATAPVATTPAGAEPVAAHPATAPLAVAPQPAPPVSAESPGVPAGVSGHDAGPRPAGAQAPPSQVPAAAAESPTVRIPEAVAASAVRTTTLPAVDPTARTRPVPEVRPAPAPGAPRPIPAPSQFVPANPVPAVAPRPAPGTARPPAVGHRPPAPAPHPTPTAPRSAAAEQAAAEAERRAAAEQRAAGIAARSNSPTVRIDMRTAQSLAENPAVPPPDPGPEAGVDPAGGGISPNPQQATPADDPARRSGGRHPGEAVNSSDDEQSTQGSNPETGHPVSGSPDSAELAPDTADPASPGDNRAPAGPAQGTGDAVAAEPPARNTPRSTGQAETGRPETEPVSGSETAEDPGPAEGAATQSAAGAVAENMVTSAEPAAESTTDEVVRAAEGATAQRADAGVAGPDPSRQGAAPRSGADPAAEAGLGAAALSGRSAADTVRPEAESGTTESTGRSTSGQAGAADTGSDVAGRSFEARAEDAGTGVLAPTATTGSAEPAAGTADTGSGESAQGGASVRAPAGTGGSEPAPAAPAEDPEQPAAASPRSPAPAPAERATGPEAEATEPAGSGSGGEVTATAPVPAVTESSEPAGASASAGSPAPGESAGSGESSGPDDSAAAGTESAEPKSGKAADTTAPSPGTGPRT